MERTFKGIWIPAEIWMNTDLTWGEKLYLLEIDSLDDGERGCYASNKYLGDFFNQTAQKAAGIIRRLEQKNRIVLEYEGKKRFIKVIDGSLKSEVTLRVKEEKSEEEQEEKDLKTTIRNLYFRLFAYKMRQLSGRMYREDGKLISPSWGGKQGSLLKKDFEQFGFTEMKRLILLFFGDQVEKVADFARYKEKAGYGYTVFHGSIEKLQASGSKPKEPCWHCGTWDLHYPECPIKQREEKKKEVEEEVVEAEREEFDGSITELFRSRLRESRQEAKGED